MQPSVLVVEDQSEVREFLVRAFQANQFTVWEAATGESGLTLAREKCPHLVTLDISLPRMTGAELCQALKKDERTMTIPVLVITGSSRDGEDILALDRGADDYLQKPVKIERLMAHARALLRRGAFLGLYPQSVKRGGLVLDLERKTVLFNERTCTDLTPKEFDLLHFLVLRERTPHARQVLYHKIWGTPAPSLSALRTVDVHVQRVRSKLGLARKQGLISVSGRGYMWSSPGTPAYGISSSKAA